MSKQSFRELGVSPPVVGALAAREIESPFPIQERVLPDALAGNSETAANLRKRVLVIGWLFGLPVPLLLMWAPAWEWVVVANLLVNAAKYSPPDQPIEAVIGRVVWQVDANDARRPRIGELEVVYPQRPARLRHRSELVPARQAPQRRCARRVRRWPCEVDEQPDRGHGRRHVVPERGESDSAGSLPALHTN